MLRIIEKAPFLTFLAVVVICDTIYHIVTAFAPVKVKAVICQTNTVVADPSPSTTDSEGGK